VQSPPSATGCGGAAPAALDAPIELQVVEFLNAERRQNGLSELQASTDPRGCREASRPRSGRGRLPRARQLRPLGRPAREVVRVVGACAALRARHAAAAENIAAGAETPREVVDGWMGSSVHRRNMLGAAYRRVGVGYWAGGRGGFYWVADFAGD
jgi:uncharacterized protein YkwD